MPAPPPPPPPGPPPPPAFNPAAFKAPAAGSSSGVADPKNRNMLLESIRQGKTLKKTTVVNDRSAPIVSAKSKASAGGGGASNVNATVGNRANGLNIPPGLGGLFAGGMPKLKSVGGGPASGAGSKGNSAQQSSVPRNASSNSLNSNNSNNSPHSSAPASPYNASGGPVKQTPPQPPPSSMKPPTPSQSPAHEERKSTNFGKPSLAPKPPSLRERPARPDPPPKLYIPPAPPAPAAPGSPQSSTPPSAGGVNRAQSMRAPKTASPTNTNASSLEYRTMGRTAGRAFAANAGVQPPPPPRIMNGGQRPRAPNAIRPPAARPPPPPNKAPPMHPPPPPPAAVPPPPPHRTAPAPPPPGVRVNGLLNPNAPQNQNGGVPPPPPTRNSSMRSATSAVSVISVGSSSGSSSSSNYSGVDLEAKFGHLFHDLSELPKPDLYTGIVKHYPSKSAQSVKRQPAPQPPTQMQLENKLWVNNTSTC